MFAMWYGVDGTLSMSQEPVTWQKPPVARPKCPGCRKEFKLTINLAALGPFKVVTMFCGGCGWVVNTAPIGIQQPQIQQAAVIPPRRMI